MLRIRKEQYEELGNISLKRFEDEMVVHSRDFSPRLCEVISEERLRVAIRQAMSRAGGYGFTNRGPVRLFIELMLLFGSDFDTDPQYAWAEEILTDPADRNQMARADRLHKKALDYMEKVFGPDHQYENDAIRRVAQERFEDLPQSLAERGDQAVSRLRKIYPQKVRYVGDSAIRELFARAQNLAQTYGMVPEVSATVLFWLMFAFGHGVTTDCQFPWVAENLRSTKDGSPDNRHQQLYIGMITYLKHGLITREAE
jgi:hypothetical protein